MQDLLLIEDQLTAEEKLIKNNVRKFSEEKVLPIISDCYERAEFPLDLIPEMANAGFFGLTLPENFGGSNASYTSYGLLCEELERGDSSIRSFVSVQNALGIYPIYKYGSEQQKNKYLKKMVQGKIISCFGLTEANAGSDPASMQTVAKKVTGGWVLNGSKLWITNANISNIAIVWAKVENKNSKKSDIRGFIVEKKFDGFTVNKINNKLSLRVSDTGELIFNNCFIPDENILPGTEGGLSSAFKCLTKARFGIAWGAIGAAEFCYEKALDYSLNRKQFNKPIASFQLIQKDLVSIYKEILKAKILNLHIAKLIANNIINNNKNIDSKIDYNQISLIKMNSCKEALKIARMARNILGANGISLEYSIMRHMNNLETVFTYEGTDNVHNLILGRYITGINAFE